MTGIRRLAALALLAGTGCVKQDAEILERVGGKLSVRLREATSGVREKLPFDLSSVGPATPAGSVRRRFASDVKLHDAPIEILAAGADVELKGAVASEELKRRAVDLAESTRGVAKVVDSLTLAERKAEERKAEERKADERKADEP